MLSEMLLDPQSQPGYIELTPTLFKFFFTKKTLAISKLSFYIQEMFDPTRSIGRVNNIVMCRISWDQIYNLIEDYEVY
jgi:hypothetical protein